MSFLGWMPPGDRISGSLKALSIMLGCESHQCNYSQKGLINVNSAFGPKP